MMPITIKIAPTIPISTVSVILLKEFGTIHLLNQRQSNYHSQNTQTQKLPFPTLWQL